MKFDADQFQHRVRPGEIDVARLAGKHAVEAQCCDQPTRLGLARQRLLPIEPVHADHEPLLGLPPDDVGGLHMGILHMGGDHRKVIGVECNQFERRIQGGIRGSLH